MTSLVSQEAVVQYEQYEQEVRDLQKLIEEAHRVIQDRPIPTNNIQELQAQILHHEVKHLFNPKKRSHASMSFSVNQYKGEVGV